MYYTILYCNLQLEILPVPNSKYSKIILAFAINNDIIKKHSGGKKHVYFRSIWLIS